jgi:hypothetical protein
MEIKISHRSVIRERSNLTCIGVGALQDDLAGKSTENFIEPF